MKKILISTVILSLISVTQLSAQVNLSGGIKASASMSNYLLQDMDYMNSNFKAGGAIGGFMNVEFGNYFALQPELQVYYRTSEMEHDVTGVTSDYEFFGAEIPIYAMGQIKFNKGKMYLGVGPYVGVGFTARNTTADIDLYEKNEITDESLFKRFDFGAGAILGYEFGFGLQINASYQIGFLNMMDAGSDDFAMRPETISLGFAYRF